MKMRNKKKAYMFQNSKAVYSENIFLSFICNALFERLSKKSTNKMQKLRLIK